MKKLALLALTFLGLTGFIKAQSFDPILASKLQYTLDSIKTTNNLKGISACIIYPGIGAWKGVAGVSHAGNPITPEMEFGIASNTKLFTGVLLLKLTENGIIDLDDSLYEYLPAMNNIDSNITIRQILNHTSGLADVISVVGYADSILTNPNRIYTPTEVMTWVGTPLFAAGTSWNYCNTNYLLAGMIAERSTGQSYGQLLHDNILSPLQLDSTFLDVYDSVLYTIAHPWQGGIDRNSTPRKALNSVSWSAGAMYSTAGEMAQWYQALMHGQILSPGSFKEMTTFVGSGSYGIGLFETAVLGRTVWHHGGTIWGGYNSSIMYDTATGIVICVLINQNPAQAFQASRQLLSTIINHPVSIHENALEEKYYKVYPNPTTDIINIDIPDQDLRSIKILDPTGRLIKESFETQFSISNFPTGIYFISAQSEKGPYLGKLIKQ
jgi:D-alanyl-D-alanine carboxypeptidase